MNKMALVLVCALSPVLAQAAYDEGRNAFERGDYQRALRELVPAADSDARAASLVSQIYLRGLGTRADSQQALLWLRRAAELGDLAAQLGLAERYAQGSVQDQRAALEWYTRAAEQGSHAAEYALGLIYAEGRGVPADASQALPWMQKAAEAGLAPRGGVAGAGLRARDRNAARSCARCAMARASATRSARTSSSAARSGRSGIRWCRCALLLRSAQ